jgi:hypothetical protein
LTRCHICTRPTDHDHDPYYVDTDPGHYDDEVGLEVAMGNHLFVRACWSCWMKWPDEHKLFPARGFGRWELTTDELVDLLRVTAP